ncbi:MAG: ExeA family protein [Halioglobus sp.]
MFETYYNLRAEPFKLSPDHRMCFEHKGYAKARAYMAYAFMRAEGFVMITGRPGTGKTTLIGDLIESLASDNVTTANLVCTQLQADDLLKTVAYSFGVNMPNADKAELLQSLNVKLHNWHRDGRRALLIVDEAQDLSVSAMEELRLLTNIQVNSQPLLQIFLLGQPELRDLILAPEMEQVHQRIVAASHLESLEVEETEAYIMHRLYAVGWQGDPALSRAIFPLIYRFSEGVPRRINLICSRLMLHGCVEQTHKIGIDDLRSVIKELQGEHLAAGNIFSEQDFMVEDEFVEYAPPQDATPAPPPEPESEALPRGEVQLRAVESDPTPPGSPEQKKKMS